MWEEKLEWNVASFVDWPLGLRVMWVKDNQPKIEEILFDNEKAPQGISGTCAENVIWKAQKDDFHFYTTYRDQKATGPTGRYMQHYLLVAELMAIVEALKSLDSNGTYLELISEKEELIREVQTRFDQRVKIIVRR